mgnify:FL=1
MKRGKLGRRGRIFRNFLLAGVLGALIWTCAGWPVPARWELRRLEREAFLSPHSQFQGSVQVDQREWLVGLTPRWLVMGRQNEFRLWPREGDGPVLAPVPEEFTLRGGIRVVAAGAPQGTASARLTLEVSHWYASFGGSSSYSSQREDILRSWPWPDSSPEYRSETVTLEGEPMEEGAFQFVLGEEEMRGTGDYIWRHVEEWGLYQGYYQISPINCRMTAVFYDESGQELDRAELQNAEAWER